MLDFFTIFTKGGIVLLYIENANEKIAQSVNSLVKSIILQELGASGAFVHSSLALKYKLDNEFELIFVVGYQKMLQLSYVDKFLDAIHLEFRNKYREELVSAPTALLSRNFDAFANIYETTLRETQAICKLEASRPAAMRSFEESQKSKKTIASMRITPGDKKSMPHSSEPAGNSAAGTTKPNNHSTMNGAKKPTSGQDDSKQGNISLDQIELNKMKMAKKFAGGGNKKGSAKDAKKDSPVIGGSGSGGGGGKAKAKQARKWADGAVSKDELATLDYSRSTEGGDATATATAADAFNQEEIRALSGQLAADLADVEVPSDEENSFEEDEVEEEAAQPTKTQTASADDGKKSRFGFGLFSRLIPGGKTLTKAEMAPALERMRNHLMAKNVAADVAEHLVDSVASKLEGKHLGTFERVLTAVRTGLEEACSQLLAPKRRVDILRDVLEARSRGVPYVTVFCGVNGVGKSTNLAKIAFWLTGQGYRVLIAACDTFRSGAVEQLKTHVRKLNSIHTVGGGKQMVQLYEKGYGKDAAGIAMEAINFAHDTKVDVVLVDTAGRMQDNEPLMRSLAKLIRVNSPDLVLFVGEALVGNDGVDQLVSFDRQLANFSQANDPHLIDGIVLTKFDTVDDKVGAAISMTYSSGQPIVFVGTGQTYTDLKRLSVPAVVKSLMK